ncbi:MAG: DUF2378 family protein [Euryarchaeota archaeon]|nr:DUF2378 family protein [Euryarchaeota archaeon]
MTKGVECVEKCGAHTTKDLGALSYIVRFMDIRTVLKKAPESFRDAFSYGSLDVEIGDRRAVIKMKDTAVDDHACPAWLGCFKGVLEVTKTPGTVRETQCQLKGASHCEFLMEW